MPDAPVGLVKDEHFNENDVAALLIVLGVLDEELPLHSSGARLGLATRIVACLSEVELIPEG